MRIISGTARGRTLKVPKEVTRPTTDRVREALFSILTPYVPNARVLDLFAGSGANGFEALSRGAKSATFVEINRSASSMIKKNASTLKFDQADVIHQDALSYIKKTHSQFDLIFADPPYKKNREDRDYASELLQEANLAHTLEETGLLILEVMSGVELLGSEYFDQIDSRSYGTSSLVFFKKKGEA